MIANNSIHTNPPLCITEDQLAEGFDDHRPRPRHRRRRGRLRPARRADRAPPMTTASGSLRRASGRPSRRRRRAGPLAPPADRRHRRSSSWRCSSSGRPPSGSAATRGGSTPRSPALQIDYEHVPPFAWRIADDLSLPHVWDIGRAFVDPAQRGGPPLGGRPRRPGGLHVRRGARRVRHRRAAGSRARRPVRPLAAGRAGARAVRRRVADRADPGHRADRRRGHQGGLAVGHGGRRLPDLLPGHDRLAARPARGRPARARAVPLLRRDAATDPLAAPAADVGAVPLLRASGSPRRRRSSARSSASRRPGVASGLGSAIINYNQYYISAPERLWATIVMCTLVGLLFVGAINVAERL